MRWGGRKQTRFGAINVEDPLLNAEADRSCVAAVENKQGSARSTLRRPRSSKIPGFLAFATTRSGFRPIDPLIPHRPLPRVTPFFPANRKKMAEHISVSIVLEGEGREARREARAHENLDADIGDVAVGHGERDDAELAFEEARDDLVAALLRRGKELPRHLPEMTRRVKENPRRVPETTRGVKENPRRLPEMTRGVKENRCRLPEMTRRGKEIPRRPLEMTGRGKESLGCRPAMTRRVDELRRLFLELPRHLPEMPRRVQEIRGRLPEMPRRVKESSRRLVEMTRRVQDISRCLG